MSDEEKTYDPPPVSGYRKITQTEIDLVNQIKDAEKAVAAVWATVKGNQRHDPRMAAHAKTVLQDGFMWLSRSVFRPEDPFQEALEHGPEWVTMPDARRG